MWGLCEREARQISIDARLSRHQRELTYIHELLHAIWPTGIVELAVEERLVDGLEEPLRHAVLDGALSISRDEVA